MSIWQTDNQILCLTFNLTGVHFQGELQLIARVNKQKINKNSGHYDIGLLDELYAKHHYECVTMVPPVYLNCS